MTLFFTLSYIKNDINLHYLHNLTMIQNDVALFLYREPQELIELITPMA